MCVLELLKFRLWKKQLERSSIKARFALASYSGVLSLRRNREVCIEIMSKHIVHQFQAGNAMQMRGHPHFLVSIKGL